MSSNSSDPNSVASPENKEAWVKTQQKTFTKWMNNHLSKKGYPPITDAQLDFDNGIKLMQVVSSLYGVTIPKYNANPRMRPHALDNIALALNMVETAKIKTNFLKPTHLIDHDLKMILGLMWAIILDYAIKGIKDDDLNAKEGLLLWCRKKTQGYREIDPPSIQNFTTHWKNGLAFCALIHRHQPHLIDYDSLDKANAAQNLELAFSVAEGLGIPRLLDVADLVDSERPDERSVMTQVAEYFHRFAQQNTKEVAARRAAKFLAFTKQVNQLKFDYERRVAELLQWVQTRIQSFDSVDFGNTIDQAIAVNDALRAFLLSEKPEKSASKLDVENLYAEIQTQLRVNNRPAYVPAPEYAPEQLDAAFESLYESEKTHARAAREHRFKFVSKKEEKLSDEKLAELTESYRHFDKDNDGALDKLEFKAALAAMSIPVKDDAALDNLLRQVTGGALTVSLDAWIRYTSELATDRDTPEQIKESFKTLADDKDTISASNLRVPPLTNEDVAYLESVLPTAANGGFDYNAFVDAAFLNTGAPTPKASYSSSSSSSSVAAPVAAQEVPAAAAVEVQQPQPVEQQPEPVEEQQPQVVAQEPVQQEQQQEELVVQQEVAQQQEVEPVQQQQEEAAAVQQEAPQVPAEAPPAFEDEAEQQ